MRKFIVSARYGFIASNYTFKQDLLRSRKEASVKVSFLQVVNVQYSRKPTTHKILIWNLNNSKKTKMSQIF
jgi:hypothetical protein